MEKRLDVLIFRLGFSRSIFESRNLIKGGFVKLNDKTIDNKSITKIINIGTKITVENTEIPYLAKIKHLKLNLLKMPTHLFTPNLKDINLTSSTNKLEGYLIKEPIESEIFLPINYQINKLRKF
jgi:ribosomal protein S4